MHEPSLLVTFKHAGIAYFFYAIDLIGIFNQKGDKIPLIIKNYASTAGCAETARNGHHPYGDALPFHFTQKYLRCIMRVECSKQFHAYIIPLISVSTQE